MNETDNICDNTFSDNVNTFNTYYIPFIICAGVIGNILSFMVFMSKKLRRIPSTHYLAALSLADSGILLLLFFTLVGGFRLFPFNGFCQVFMYLSNVLYFVSVWCVVGFTIERFVAVLFPLHRLKWFTVRHCRTIIGALCFVALLWNLYAVILTKPVKFAETNETYCTSPEEHWNSLLILNYADTVVTLVMPVLIITVLNSFISAKLLLGADRAQGMLNSMTESCRRTYLAAMHKNDERITKTLLLVSVFFLVMNLPDHVLRLIISTSLSNGAIPIRSTTTNICRLLEAQRITNVLFNTNFANNFVLYNLMGKNFRQHLMGMLSDLFRMNIFYRWISQASKNQRNNTSTSTTNVVGGLPAETYPLI